MIALLGPAPDNQSIFDSLGQLKIHAFIVAAGHLEDLYSDFARLYGAQGSFLYLLRPDGHVGLFQHKADSATLTAYLKKIRDPQLLEKAFAEG
jgi:hypothetical protein